MSSPDPHLGWRQAWRYGLMGLPLAFVALPLYVLLPHHYAREFGVPLGVLGLVLLVARLVDAMLDPWLGRWCDRLFARSLRAVWLWAAGACVLMGLGVVMLFYPPLRDGNGLLAVALLLLVLTYAAYSAAMLAHQSWGALFGGDAVLQSRLAGWREGFGLVGVLLASVVPWLLGLPVALLLFVLALLLGALVWRTGPAPTLRSVDAGELPLRALWQPWRRRDFRRLMAVFIVNGIASAIPATLLLFFVQDQLRAPASMEPLFLGSYFLAAALSMPLWLGAVRRQGVVRCWLAGMLLAVAMFVWASRLEAGDALAFLFICMACGVALGADLAFPPALLARLMAELGDLGRAQGTWFGWWNSANKFNLALAAGLALPLLGIAGYAPGVRDPAALQALTLAYCLLPCLLKLAAAGLLYWFFIRHPGGLRSVP